MGRYENDYDDERVVVIERERESSSNALGMLLLGLAVGAGAALLYAPSSGEETRQRLRDEARRAKQRMRDLGDEFAGELSERVGRTREVVDRNINTAREKVTSRARAMSEAVEAGREAAHQARGELERAVAETKRAYSDSRRNLRSRADEGMNAQNSGNNTGASQGSDDTDAITSEG